MILSKSAVFDSKRLRFIEEQEVSESLSSLGIKTTLSKIALLGNILF